MKKMKQSNGIVTKGNLSSKSYWSQSPNEKKPRLRGQNRLERGANTLSTEPEVGKKT